MELKISLSPSGGLRLHIPNGKRTLDLPIDYAERIECPCCGERSTVKVESAMLRTLKRVLKNAEDYVPEHAAKGHIGAFPTQAIVDIWLRQNTVEDEAVRKERAEAKRLADEKAKFAEKGIDIGSLEFKL